MGKTAVLFDFPHHLLRRGEGFFVVIGRKYQGKEMVGMGSNRYGVFPPGARAKHTYQI